MEALIAYGEATFGLKRFPKQDLALADAEADPRRMVLARDLDLDDKQGSKEYFTAEPVKFGTWYEMLSASERRFYEVIREGPVHLYFDLETKRELGECDDDAIYAEFKRRVWKKCREEFGEEPAEVVELVASNDKKFSMHAVYKLRNFRFANYEAAKHFVKGLDYSGILTRNGLPVADQLVYTKNRCFRLWLSSKRTEGKPRPLLAYGGEEIADLASTLVEARRDPGRLVRAPEAPPPSVSKKRRRDPLPFAPRPRGEGLLNAAVSEIEREWECTLTIHSSSGDKYTLKTKDGKKCATAEGGYHHSNHTRFYLDMGAGTYVQSCFNAKCGAKKRETLNLSEPLLRELERREREAKEFDSEVDREFWEVVFQ